jgi:hypothetical protein
VVLLADWRPDRAKQALEQAGANAAELPVHQGLLAVSRVLSGDLRALIGLRTALESASTAVESNLEHSRPRTTGSGPPP